MTDDKRKLLTDEELEAACGGDAVMPDGFKEPKMKTLQAENNLSDKPAGSTIIAEMQPAAVNLAERSSIRLFSTVKNEKGN